MFDEFEGEEYYKVHVQPQLVDGTVVDADMYIWQDKLWPLLQGEWSEEDFRLQHLSAYVNMCKEFASDLKDSQCMQ